MPRRDTAASKSGAYSRIAAQRAPVSSSQGEVHLVGRGDRAERLLLEGLARARPRRTTSAQARFSDRRRAARAASSCRAPRARGSPSPQERPGLWQVAHDITPERERRGSKKSVRPSSTRASLGAFSAGCGTCGRAPILRLQRRQVGRGAQRRLRADAEQQRGAGRRQGQPARSRPSVSHLLTPFLRRPPGASSRGGSRSAPRPRPGGRSRPLSPGRGAAPSPRTRSQACARTGCGSRCRGC